MLFKYVFRAKEEAKRQQAEAEFNERKRIENETAQELARKEAHRREVEASLPAEPPLDQGDGITKIRFRLPNGDNLERRFLAYTTLKVLLDYLTVQGYPTQEYKVISSWPRRDVSSFSRYYYIIFSLMHIKQLTLDRILSVLTTVWKHIYRNHVETVM